MEVKVVSKEENRLPLLPKKHRIKLNRMVITTFIVILVLIPVSFVFNANEPIIVKTNNGSNFPTYYFNPSLCPNNGNVVRPIENKTFTTERNSIDIFCNSPSMSLGRNFTGMAFNFTSTFDFKSKSTNFSVNLISSSQFNLTLEHDLLPDLNLSDSIPVSYAKDPSSRVLSTNKIFPRYHKIQKNEQIQYNINDSFSSGFFYFIFKDENQGTQNRNIFCAQNNQSSISLNAENGSFRFSYVDFNAKGPLKTVYINNLNVSYNWNFVLLHPSLDTTYIDMDGSLFKVGVNPFTNTTLFYFGSRASRAQSNLSCSNLVSHLYYYFVM